MIATRMDTFERRMTPSLLKIGGRVKVEVHLADPPVVLHTSVRLCDSHVIELDAPVVQGKRMGVLPGTQITVTEVSPNGLLLVETDVIQVRTKPLPVWDLRIPGLEKIRHIQRRRADRYEVDLHLRWKKREDESWPAHSLLHMVNVSTFGAFVAMPVELETGEEIIIDLTSLILVGGNTSLQHRITPRCKVVRCTTGPMSCYGLTFENLDRVAVRYLDEAIRRLKSKRV